MATISDVTIIDSNTAEARPVASGLERTICSEALCGSKNLTVYRRTVIAGRQFAIEAGDDYHIVYVMQGAADGSVRFGGAAHRAESGAGVLLAPGERKTLSLTLQEGSGYLGVVGGFRRFGEARWRALAEVPPTVTSHFLVRADALSVTIERTGR